MVSHNEQTAFSQNSFSTTEIDPSNQELLGIENPSFLEPHYPLELHFSKSLSHLKLLKDGSELFVPKTSQEPYFSPQSSIEYAVTISSQTGKILYYAPTQEGADTQLEKQAEMLLSLLTFAKEPSDEILSGTIALTFYLSSEELEKLLQKRGFS